QSNWVLPFSAFSAFFARRVFVFSAPLRLRGENFFSRTFPSAGVGGRRSSRFRFGCAAAVNHPDLGRGACPTSSSLHTLQFLLRLDAIHFSRANWHDSRSCRRICS